MNYYSLSPSSSSHIVGYFILFLFVYLLFGCLFYFCLFAYFVVFFIYYFTVKKLQIGLEWHESK